MQKGGVRQKSLRTTGIDNVAIRSSGEPYTLPSRSTRVRLTRLRLL